MEEEYHYEYKKPHCKVGESDSSVAIGTALVSCFLFLVFVATFIFL